MKSLPVEILLQIAGHISNMWDREDYLKALDIDHLYYNGRSRPVSKTFVPRRVLPIHTLDTDFQDEGFSKINTRVRLRVAPYVRYEIRVTTVSHASFRPSISHKLLFFPYRKRRGQCLFDDRYLFVYIFEIGWQLYRQLRDRVMVQRARETHGL